MYTERLSIHENASISNVALIETNSHDHVDVQFVYDI